MERLFSNLSPGIKIEVKKEFHPFIGNGNAQISSPILDIAVGPFATQNQQIGAYQRMALDLTCKEFLEKAILKHNNNIEQCNESADHNTVLLLDDALHENGNPRCFLAIEIEGRVDRKVVLADIVNTSALGKIGVIVAKTDKVRNIFLRLLNYLNFLRDVGKPTYNVKNILILTKEQFKEILES